MVIIGVVKALGEIDDLSGMTIALASPCPAIRVDESTAAFVVTADTSGGRNGLVTCECLHEGGMDAHVEGGPRMSGHVFTMHLARCLVLPDHEARAKGGGKIAIEERPHQNAPRGEN